MATLPSRPPPTTPVQCESRDGYPDDKQIDARVWVETIPFNETRNYVRRVLAADVIFAWRMTGEVPRLSDRLPAIQPPRQEGAVSSQ